MQVLVEYQVPNFEMAISFELRLDYVSYMRIMESPGYKESEKWQMKSIRFNFETLIIPLRLYIQIEQDLLLMHG